jgi:hypothetical protein
MKNTKILFKIVFSVWVFMWLLFLVRGLIKVEIKDYRNLIGKTLEEKRAYVSGKEFYRFVLFCEGLIPKNSTYSVEAKYDQTLDYFRFAYYLYPAMRDIKNPEYIACYKMKFFKEGYYAAVSLTEDQYILKRNK